jgi:hypothetical protein
MFRSLRKEHVFSASVVSRNQLCLRTEGHSLQQSCVAALIDLEPRAVINKRVLRLGMKYGINARAAFTVPFSPGPSHGIQFPIGSVSDAC